MTVEWSSTPPTENGYYWVRKSGERSSIVKLHTDREYVSFIGGDWDAKIGDERMDGYEFGPKIDPPQ